MSYALNRYNSGIMTSSNQFNTGGRLPYVEHRVVSEKPLVWQPHSIYYVKYATAEISEHYWVDASGIPHQVGDAAFVAWKARAGNETKTIEDFINAITAGLYDAAAVISGVFDPLRLTPAVWHDAANGEAVAANGHYNIIAGRTLKLVNIGQGNECWIRLADEAAGWSADTVNFDVPTGWSTSTLLDPGPASIVTVVCDTASQIFTFHA